MATKKLTGVYNAGLINITLVNFAEDHSISQCYIIKLCKEHSQLPTTCYFQNYGQNATDLQYDAEPNDQHYTAQKKMSRREMRRITQLFCWHVLVKMHQN